MEKGNCIKCDDFKFLSTSKLCYFCRIKYESKDCTQCGKSKLLLSSCNMCSECYINIQFKMQVKK